MPSFTNSKLFYFALPVVSGILSGFSILYLSPWLAWIMLVPLFYSVFDSGYSFLKGIICGTILGLIVLSWMISSIGKYTGTESNLGYTLWMLTSIYYGIVVGVQLWIIGLIFRSTQKKKNAWWINAISAGCIWIILDWVRIRLLPGMPWMHYQVYGTFLKWLAPVQLTAFTGEFGLTFLIVFINYLITETIISTKYLRLAVPLVILCIVILFGFLRVDIYPVKSIKTKVSLICENLKAKDRWSSKNCDSLITQFYKLNKEAVKDNPQLIVWSETALPWELAMNDKILTNILQTTWPSQAGHIIGIYSPSDKIKDKRYNSAYYIKPDGAITGRYDKMQLLTLLEKPVKKITLPFFNHTVRTDLLEGKNRNLLLTPFGKAGILICNESLSTQPFRETVRLGANFLVVMSNDAWFEGTQLIQHHFYMNRLRAVESGMDMIVNSNRGISGIIDSKGNIVVSENSNKPNILSGSFTSRVQHTFYTKNGDWLITVSIIYMAIILITIITTKSKKI